MRRRVTREVAPACQRGLDHTENEWVGGPARFLWLARRWADVGGRMDWPIAASGWCLGRAETDSTTNKRQTGPARGGRTKAGPPWEAHR